MPAPDQVTADAFATSWNNLPSGSVYTFEQFKDWLLPLTKNDIQGKTILELGCGNGSLLTHLTQYEPAFIEGVDLGSSIVTCEENMKRTGFINYKLSRVDITQFETTPKDIVYCIGVLQHLKKPEQGFESVLKNTKSGGRFHCWVYAREGNGVIVYIVDPLRKLVSKFPWRLTKYFIATPLAVPYFFYAKLISRSTLFSKFPLYDYSCWISKRGFAFFRHVAFDQLVSPQTTYFPRKTIEEWLNKYPGIDKNSTYTIMRNGNSWKFGGKKICAE